MATSTDQAGTGRPAEDGRPAGWATTLAAKFGEAASTASDAVGSAWAFLVAVGVIVVWAATGRLFGFSDTWQLVINTGTTVVTFLMVFLIQNTQNRDARAIHLKLDELIRAMRDARNDLIDVEEATDKQLQALQETYRELRQPGTGVPELPEHPEQPEHPEREPKAA